jgi:hypothetical protein
MLPLTTPTYPKVLANRLYTRVASAVYVHRHCFCVALFLANNPEVCHVTRGYLRYKKYKIAHTGYTPPSLYHISDDNLR